MAIKKEKKQPIFTGQQPQSRAQTPAPTQNTQPVFTGQQPQSRAPTQSLATPSTGGSGSPTNTPTTPVFNPQVPQSVAPVMEQQQQPQINQPSEFTGGTGEIQPDPRNALQKNPIYEAGSEFASGFMNPEDPLNSRNTGFETAGGVARTAGEIALAGTGGDALLSGASNLLTKGVKSLKSLADSRKAGKTLSEIERLGGIVEKSGGFVSAGDKVAGQFITPSKAKLINSVLLEEAKKVSPIHWKSILGILAGGGAISGLVVGSSWLGQNVQNSYGDADQSLGYARDTFYSEGNIARGDEIQELMDEFTLYYDSLYSTVFSDPFTTEKAKVRFVQATREKGQIVRDAKLEQMDLAEKKNGLLNNWRQGLSAGTYDIDSPIAGRIMDQFPDSYEAGFIARERATAAKFKAIEEKGIADEEANAEKFAAIREQKLADQQAVADSIAQAKIDKDDAKLEELEFQEDILHAGSKITDYIIDNELTAEQIVNDEKIRAFALDANNWATSVRTIYDQANESLARSNAQGGGFTAPPSTLGFGLLNTGGEFTDTSPAQQTPTPTAPLDPIDERALSMFGIPYAQLTDEQKAQL